jgi:hypothetical protein
MGKGGKRAQPRLRRVQNSADSALVSIFDIEELDEIYHLPILRTGGVMASNFGGMNSVEAHS